ncbi:hypothetical protein SAMN04515671_1832 [Nakamurella panacisegetis]|uniref:Uncharacterized protein n=1 Tax=Nakamurella panacisegetis TaxID=1090615 RepID=A0A1H0LWC4_9ACTN|nr:DUF6049 family protein [Nakamurella panacisegetis]SDO72467.1 hypothetical protein SAMN04515671_1832 [Nakamurella panacisegetis]
MRGTEGIGRRARRSRAGAVLLALFLGLALPLSGVAEAASPGPGPGPGPGTTVATHQPGDDDRIPANAAPARGAAKAISVTGSPSPSATPGSTVSYLTSTISSISPTVVTATSVNLLTVVGTVTNTWSKKIYDVKYQFRRNNALATVKDIKTEISTPATPGGIGPASWTRLGPTAIAPTTAVDLGPGESLTFVAAVELSSPTGLAIGSAGVYPVSLQIDGDIGQNGNVDYVTVGSMHLLTTVLAVPGVTTGAGSTTANGAGSASLTPNRLNMLWPLVDTPHVGVQGVFLDDDLARLVSPGGRLYKVLAELGRTDVGSGSTTVVVDPELLDELSQMSKGYLVAKTKGAAQPALTAAVTESATSTSVPASAIAGGTAADSSRATATTTTRGAATSASARTEPLRATSGGSSTASTTSASSAGRVTTTTTNTTPTTTTPSLPIQTATVPGTGQAAATTFLATLRAAVANRQVLVLPYSNPDAVAMVRAGLTSQLSGLITKGRTVAAKVLGLGAAVASGPGLVTTMTAPEDGYVDQATLDFMSANGMTGAVLTPRTLEYSGDAAGAVSIGMTGGTRTVRAAVTDADLLTEVNDLVAKGTTAGLPVRLTTLAALLTGAAQDGTGTPIVIWPTDRWSPNAAGVQVLAGLLRTLAGGNVVAGTSLPAIAAASTTRATVSYPDSAGRAELDPGYVARWSQVEAGLSSLSKSLSKAKGLDTPDPSAQLSPLVTALTPLLSSSLRDGAGVSSQVLDTAGATIGSLRAAVQITGTDATTYTLAAATSPLLLTVRNDTPYVVRIRVRVQGKNVGMTTTDPGVLSVAAGRSQQFRIESKVVKAGKFPVEAQLIAADGSAWGPPKTITVQSSAYGTLTLIIIAVAGGALFLMVVIRLFGRIRGRNRDVDGRPGNLRPGQTSTDDPVGPTPVDDQPADQSSTDNSATGENQR